MTSISSCYHGPSTLLLPSPLSTSLEGENILLFSLLFKIFINLEDARWLTHSGISMGKFLYFKIRLKSKVVSFRPEVNLNSFSVLRSVLR